MKQNEQWLKWAVELQSLAQAGLFYTKDVFDKERFERIREIAAEIVNYKTDIPMDKVKEVFCNESGYQTPKIETRAAIFQDDKILLIQEKNGLWAMPGGWCDVGLSVGENAVKEAREEAGVDVRVELVVAVQDHDKHHPEHIFAQKICTVLVVGTLLGGSFKENSETLASGYFPLDELPPLMLGKTTPEQIKMCLDAYRNADSWKTLVD